MGRERRLPRPDGPGPHQRIDPGTTWSPEWTVKQPAAILWYHPHLHGRTAAHVFVNGTRDPHFPVTTTHTRLRILTGSTARIYHLGFTDDRSFQVVGTDSGLLPAPVETSRVVVSPGERVEVVVAMSPGERTVLRSFPGGIGTSYPDTRFTGADDTFDIIQLRAAESLRPTSVPDRLSVEPPIEAPAGARVREFHLGGRQSIDDERMEPGRENEVPTTLDSAAHGGH